MQTPFDIPADLDTPVSAYLKLRPFRPRFLLESVIGGAEQARYSFLGFGEGREVRLDAAGLHSGDVHQAAPATRAELLAALGRALAEAPRLHPALGELPFQGGLVGVAGYELVRRFERLPARRTNPLHPECAFFAPRSLLVFDHLSRRMALLSDGDEVAHRELRREILRMLRGPVPEFQRGGRIGEATPSLDREAYLAAVDRAKEEINAGEVYQLVLSTRYEGECDLDPVAAYRALRLINPSPYMFLQEFADLTVVGASPEAMVKLAGRKASLQPIAGTRARGPTADTDQALEAELRADPKEAAEHVMLVDLARNDLGRVAVPGTVKVDPYREVERFSHVMHLVSTVSGVIEHGTNAFDLFAATFPAGTVVGAPKVRAMELIDEIEPVGRGLYAGTVGYFGHGATMDQAIAIRTLVFRAGTYSYQAGAGIVADSRPRAEHDEVLAKSDALRAALSLAAEGL
ncbi:MAG: anthranilate synthase component I family protein [Planctomycetota bacterium]